MQGSRVSVKRPAILSIVALTPPLPAKRPDATGPSMLKSVPIMLSRSAANKVCPKTHSSQSDYSAKLQPPCSCLSLVAMFGSCSQHPFTFLANKRNIRTSKLQIWLLRGHVYILKSARQHSSSLCSEQLPLAATEQYPLWTTPASGPSN